MKSFTKMLLCCASIAGVAALFSSCDKNGGGDEAPVMTGNSIFVPNATDTVITVTLQMESDWQVSNQSTWFAVNPLSGAAGEVTLNISVLEANPELTEKVSSFIIKSEGDVNTQYFVIQDVTPGFNITQSIARVNEEEQTYTYTVEGNVKYEAVPEVDWITVNAITYDSTLLADEATYSKYMTSHIELSVSANSGAVREGNIALNGVDGETTATIAIGQWGSDMAADFSKTFFRRSFMIKHTADWCGPCGMASEYIHQAMEERPGRMLWAGFYQSCNESSLSAWSGVSAYYRVTASTGIPTSVMNNYCIMVGAYPASTLVGLLDEATEKLPAETVLGGYAAIENGNIVVDLSIASKETGNYKVSVFVLEDGLEYYQAGVGNNYVHENVARTEMTDMWGEAVSLEANSVKKMSFTAAVPSYVENEANLHICAVVYKNDTFTGSVSGMKYSDIEGLVVDNAVDIPINGFCVFEYEE